MIPTPSDIIALVQCLDQYRFGGTLFVLSVVIGIAAWTVVYGPWSRKHKVIIKNYRRGTRGRSPRSSSIPGSRSHEQQL